MSSHKTEINLLSFQNNRLCFAFELMGDEVNNSWPCLFFYSFFLFNEQVYFFSSNAIFRNSYLYTVHSTSALDILKIYRYLTSENVLLWIKDDLYPCVQKYLHISISWENSLLNLNISFKHKFRKSDKIYAKTF